MSITKRELIFGGVGMALGGAIGDRNRGLSEEVLQDLKEVETEEQAKRAINNFFKNPKPFYRERQHLLVSHAEILKTIQKNKQVTYKQLASVFNGIGDCRPNVPK